jgi:ribosomal protein L37AE/L43A
MKILLPLLMTLLMGLAIGVSAAEGRDGIRYQCPRCGQVEYHPRPGYWYCSSCKTRMIYNP